MQRHERKGCRADAFTSVYLIMQNAWFRGGKGDLRERSTRDNKATNNKGVEKDAEERR